jgi:hypothetical protein
MHEPLETTTKGCTMTTTKNRVESLDAATEPVKELNERLLDAGRRVGNLYVDGYERTVEGVTAFQKKLGGQSRIEGVQTLVEAQADLTRELGKAQTAVAREILS